MSLLDIPVRQLRKYLKNPRVHYDEKSLEAFAETLRKGAKIEERLKVTKAILNKETVYYVIDGSRRLAAAQRAGLETVPCDVRQLNAVEAAELALLLNFHRQDLNEMERTEAVLAWLGECMALPEEDVIHVLRKLLSNVKKGKQEDIQSGRLGADLKSQLEIVEEQFEKLGWVKWKNYVDKKLPMVSFPETLKTLLRQNAISEVQARELEKLPKKKLQPILTKLLEQLQEHGEVNQALINTAIGKEKNVISLKLNRAVKGIGKLSVGERKRFSARIKDIELEIDSLLTELEQLQPDSAQNS
jgi:ParB/RepB/Spo0J family partition protein